MFPTPKVQTGDYNYSGGNHDKPVYNLQGAIKTNALRPIFPTPTDPSNRGGAQSPSKRKAGGHAVNLDDMIRFGMPAPTANRRSGLQSHGTNILAGSLNPAFVEWLQGVPIGWTAFEPLETQSYQEWRRSHGEL